MSNTIAQLEPNTVWQQFYQLTQVPRPSKKEEKVQAHVLDFARKHKLEHQQDEAGNIIIRKRATKGMEDRRPVVLQAHLDMVCQKNGDVDFDFENDPIRTHIEGDWVTAEGTTLGADNGMGAAAILAILASDDIPHPPLEGLFTADEEAGMTGAHHLKGGLLQGEILMNLDTEDDDELSIGCAGGIDSNAQWSYPETEVPSDYEALRLQVKGLYGGHSGMDIIQGRGNANKLLNRLLWDLPSQHQAGLGHLEGGGLRNAIPREAEAMVLIPHGARAAVDEIWEARRLELKAEFATTDPGLEITWTDADSPAKMMINTAAEQLVLALQCVHDGIRRLSPDVDDLVETSNNLAHIKARDGQFTAKMLTRSDRDSAKNDLAHSVAAPFRLIGGSVEHSGAYPGWKLNPQTPMLQMMEKLYQELFSEAPRVLACHAGLECGLLGQNYPEMEMISFGPTIKDPHSPDERVSIYSVQKFWHYLQEALKRIPKAD